MVKQKKQEKLTIAEYRRRKLKRGAKEAEAKIPFEMAKERAKLETQKQFREFEKERESIAREKQKKIATLAELRDIYPEMNEADFKRFVKSQFGIEQPVEVSNLSTKITKQAQAQQPIANIQKLTKQQLEELAKEQEGQERLRLLAEAKKKGRLIDTTRKSIEDTKEKIAQTAKELELLKQLPIYSKFSKDERLLRGNAKGFKLSERQNYYKIKEALKDKELEAKKLRAIEEQYKKEIEDLGEKYVEPKKPINITKITPAMRAERDRQAEELFQQAIQKTPKIVVRDIDEEQRRKLADIEAKEQDLIGDISPEADALREKYEKEKKFINSRLQKIQPDIDDFADIFAEPAPAPVGAAAAADVDDDDDGAGLRVGLGLNKKYAIHPKHIKEGKKNYHFNAKAKKHIDNLYKILPAEKVNQICQFSILNKARNDIQELDKKFKNKKTVRGYKAHGGNLFSSLLENIF
jgi:hypothetical protein